jgi:molybdate transport system substrate-binding protein
MPLVGKPKIQAMNRTRRLSCLALPLILWLGAVSASAAEIKVLCANPVQEGLIRLAEAYKRETGHDVKVQVVTTPEFTRLLAAGDAGDIVVGTTAIVDQAIKDQKTAGAKTTVGRVGVGVAVRRGLAVPNVSTADALKSAALKADSLVYNTAGSGQYVEKLFDQFGITEQIKTKSTRPGNAAQTMDRVVQGKGNEIGFGLMSEMKPYEKQGVQLAPFPAGLQNYTNYEAVVLAGARASDPAKDFIRFITTPAAKQTFAATGVD